MFKDTLAYPSGKVNWIFLQIVNPANVPEYLNSKQKKAAGMFF